jgi:3-oxoacyl-[acyl-carrier protein] reductase
MNFDLKGRICLVTGGTGQLGRAIVRTLSACEADVAIHYNANRKKAIDLRDEILAASRKAVVVQADVTEAASIAAMKEEVGRLLGPPAVIVDNAVIQYQWKHVLQQSVEDYESQFRSCVLQNVLMAQAFVPAMIESRWGRVIAVNTECAMQCFAGQSAYVSGKRGMDGVLRVLAKEIGEHGITVNQVAPGWMMSDDSTDPAPAYSERVPLRHRGAAEDVANAVAFLASDLASFITGAYIPVCGGNVMPTI